MTIYVHYIKEPEIKITIWDKQADSCIVQRYFYGKKSKKTSAKIRHYNKKPYVMCCGHRYYLDKFIKVEI